MKEGWLIVSDESCMWRVWREESTWGRDPQDFLDRGSLLPEGPLLLKEGGYRMKEAAEHLLWSSIQAQGVETLGSNLPGELLLIPDRV